MIFLDARNRSKKKIKAVRRSSFILYINIFNKFNINKKQLSLIEMRFKSVIVCEYYILWNASMTHIYFDNNGLENKKPHNENIL